MKKVLYLNNIEDIIQYIDKSVIDYINEGEIKTFESFPKFTIIAFDWYNIHGKDEEPSQIMIYIDKDDIFFLCENEYSLKKAENLFRDTETNEKTLYMFFLGLIREDAMHLENLEDRITLAENEVLLKKNTDMQERIVSFRRELLELKKYYEQLDSIFEELEDNENGLISIESLNYFAILGNRTDRLLSNVINLRDYVTQVREAYQAEIDIEQNKLMKIFTFVTSIFLPLTLIVGWYGMNFRMPEFNWTYGYPMVIGISVLIIALWLIIFKKKKWF